MYIKCYYGLALIYGLALVFMLRLSKNVKKKNLSYNFSLFLFHSQYVIILILCMVNVNELSGVIVMQMLLFGLCLPRVFTSYICLVSPYHRWINTPRTREKIIIASVFPCHVQYPQNWSFYLGFVLIERLVDTMIWWEENNRMNNGIKGDRAGFMR